MVADAAYETRDLLRVLAVAGHTALIEPKPLAMAVEAGFTIDDFAFGDQTGHMPG